MLKVLYVADISSDWNTTIGHSTANGQTYTHITYKIGKNIDIQITYNIVSKWQGIVKSMGGQFP